MKPRPVLVVHGGPDGGPEPIVDFSTNVHPLGPAPVVARRVRLADARRYPDPAYRRLRARLAAAYGATPEGVAVGAGATELLHRLAQWRGGRRGILLWRPSFGEYAAAAYRAGRRVRWVRCSDAFAEALSRVDLAVVGVPHNPTGATFARALPHWAERAAAGVPLVVDLAYYDLCEEPPALPPTVWRLLSPTKAFGLPGVRAGALLAPEDLEPLRRLAPAWILGSHGVALLDAHLDPGARAWLERTRPRLWRWRRRLATDLRRRGLVVRESPANFLLVRVGAATAVAAALRRHGLRARDATSFGWPAWLRLSAQPPRAQRRLLAALDHLTPR
jgi:histidinol-phosphate aminotransferase